MFKTNFCVLKIKTFIFFSTSVALNFLKKGYKYNKLKQ